MIEKRLKKMEKLNVNNRVQTVSQASKLQILNDSHNFATKSECLVSTIKVPNGELLSWNFPVERDVI